MENLFKPTINLGEIFNSYDKKFKCFLLENKPYSGIKIPVSIYHFEKILNKAFEDLVSALETQISSEEKTGLRLGIFSNSPMRFSLNPKKDVKYDVILSTGAIESGEKHRFLINPSFKIILSNKELSYKNMIYFVYQIHILQVLSSYYWKKVAIIKPPFHIYIDPKIRIKFFSYWFNKDNKDIIGNIYLKYPNSKIKLDHPKLSDFSDTRFVI